MEFSEKSGWSLQEGNLRTAGVEMLPKDIIAELTN
jgi:hypothetical protein